MNIWALKTGLVFGLAIAAFHAAWAGLVLIGWAQPVADFIFWIHFIKPPYAIQPFELGKAGLLVAVTGITGFVMGWTLASLWLAIRPNPG